MVIVITAYPIVLGFMLSFILLNVQLSEGNPVPESLEDSTTQPSVTEVKNVNISSLPFSTQLSNPCSVTQRRRVNPIMDKARYAIELYKYISSYANLYKRDTLTVLNQYAITDCISLGLDILPGTPSLEELMEMDGETAINQIYYSLLVHSAYVYLIHHQYKGEEPKCLHVLPHEKLLAAHSLILANKQKSLVCTIETSMYLLGYNQNLTRSILELEVSELNQCSRMALRDCQVLRSIAHLLNVVSSYAQTKTT